LKIVVFRYDVRIVTPLSTRYDDCRRFESVTTNSKISLPAVPRRGPEAGVLRIFCDFHGSGLNQIDSCLVLQSPFYYHKKREESINPALPEPSLHFKPIWQTTGSAIGICYNNIIGPP